MKNYKIEAAYNGIAFVANFVEVGSVVRELKHTDGQTDTTSPVRELLMHTCKQHIVT
jgi:hypothetical protein